MLDKVYNENTYYPKKQDQRCTLFKKDGMIKNYYSMNI